MGTVQVKNGSMIDVSSYELKPNEKAKFLPERSANVLKIGPEANGPKLEEVAA